MTKGFRDESDGVEAVFDALHGNIDLQDFTDDKIVSIQGIISAPFIQRLRRIKQLGYVSQNFLSAQHNRYSHVLGTIHMMRRLITRLDGDDSLFHRTIESIYALTEDAAFQEKSEATVNIVKQHLLVAAAIQDVGELPYERATANIFLPGESMRGTLSDARIDINQISKKDIFTLYFLWNEAHYRKYFFGINRTLLTFLVSGLVPTGRSASNELSALRQMVDGTIDADRLDYVYRDALHTIGIHHTPDALINSIVDFDEEGPELSHVRPVTDFIITRAMLWSNVYLSPENRFRLILLRQALRELAEMPAVVNEYFGWKPHEVTEERFLALDDLYIDNLIQKVHQTKPSLTAKGLQAFELLQDGGSDYEYRWIRFADEPDPSWEGPIQTPRQFYWDTYADYRERKHTLYDQGTVKITGQRYSLLADRVPLEQCVGPFCSMLQSGTWPALPMDNHMAWFAPRSVWSEIKGVWAPLMQFQNAQQLTSQLQFNDLLQATTFVADTRKLPGYSGRAIFVAFAWEDREFVRRLAGILTDLKRRYFVWLDFTQGKGQSTEKNSQEAVDAAEAVILLASKEYVKSYQQKSNGPIHGEVSRMEAKHGQIPIVPIGLDDYDEIKDDFPWTYICSEPRPPFLGTPLRVASSTDFRRSVEDALAFIDSYRGQ